MGANNICIVSPSLKMGGIERSLVVIANYFSAKEYSVTFISCLAGEHFYALGKDINLIEPGFHRTGGLFNKLVFYPRIIRFIRKKVKMIQPDTVLVFGDLFSPLVLLSLQGTRFPVYISDRTSPDYSFSFPIPLMKKLLYPRSAGFIAQTNKAVKYKQSQFGNKLNIKVIPNALREVKTYPVPREKIILYVGRFAWEKAPERLIQSFAELEDRNGWTLVMAGSGPLLEKMKRLVNELNLTDEVSFPGRVDNVDRLYAKAGIYVLPSKVEGFPNSLCEAMAAGLPVICYNSIPWKEIIEAEVNGLVVQNDDIEGLVIAISKLINSEALREQLGRNARSIQDKLRVEKIGAQVTNFIFSQ